MSQSKVCVREALFIRLLPVVLLLLSAALLTSCDRFAESKDVAAPRVVDRITLTNGGVMQGRIVSETDQEVKIEWQDGIVGFYKNEVIKIERDIFSDQATADAGDVHVPTFFTEEQIRRRWPDNAKHLVTLTNTERIGGTIKKLTDEILTLRQALEGGGAIEHDFEIARVEKIALWRPLSPDPNDGFEEFRASYPNMELIEKDYYRILSSEQDALDLKNFLKTLNHFYHDFLFHFFDLIDQTENPPPLDVIMYGSREEFDKALEEVGYNARSNPIGFYEYNSRKLVFYNTKSELAVQLLLAKSRQRQTEIADLKKQYSSGLHSSVDQAQEQAEKKELEVLAYARTQSFTVLRHEGGHQLFHALNLTPKEVYMGGWLIEGLAVYCETNPIGEISAEKVMALRYGLEKGDLMPIEYLVNFAMGSGFHRMDPLYAQVAYAESWAFVSFLMKKGYRDGFFKFIRAIKHQGPEYEAHGERALLEKHIGKNLKELGADFESYMKKLVETYVDEKKYEEFRYGLVTQF